MAPFRSNLVGELLTAPALSGTLSLEVAPRHVALRLAEVQLAITEGTIIVSRALRRGARRVVQPIVGRLVVARGLPREALGLWHETRPGEVERVFGVEPRALVSDDSLVALRQLDRLARRLGQALSELGRGARSAFEIGPSGARGLDKVLVIDDGDLLTVYRRSLFHTRARRLLSASTTGEVTIATSRGDLRITCQSHYGVSVIGDYLRFSTAAGDDLARVALPWIAREDRDELARRIGQVVDR